MKYYKGYFYNLFKKGSRIALKAKVNDSLISGLTIIDSILPVGRGQRQLILGDRYSGKTSIFLSFLITSNRFNFIGSLDGFGIKRLFILYIGINQNLSKLSKLLYYLLFN
jgi:F-type H+-transporting ATPase subunit alpha